MSARQCSCSPEVHVAATKAVDTEVQCLAFSRVGSSVRKFTVPPIALLILGTATPGPLTTSTFKKVRIEKLRVKCSVLPDGNGMPID